MYSAVYSPVFTCILRLAWQIKQSRNFHWFFSILSLRYCLDLLLNPHHIFITRWEVISLQVSTTLVDNFVRINLLYLLWKIERILWHKVRKLIRFRKWKIKIMCRLENKNQPVPHKPMNSLYLVFWTFCLNWMSFGSEPN